MKILVAGANGQVGRKIAEMLVHTPWTFLLCNRDQLDISQRENVFEVVTQFLPDIIINAAAFTSVEAAEHNPNEAYAINAQGAGYLAECAKQIHCALIHISTDFVFDGSKTSGYVETDLTNPTNIYGKSKLAGEQALQSIHAKTIILRTAWVFGEHGHNFVKTLLRLGQERAELQLVTDQIGTPVYTGDLASTILTICEKIAAQSPIAWGIYHYGGQQSVSRYEFAQAIFAEANRANLFPHNNPTLIAIRSDQFHSKVNRPNNSSLNSNKIETAFPVIASDWRAALQDIELYV
jgi:dTDP-4-dehydrorhamnose reductase